MWSTGAPKGEGDGPKPLPQPERQPRKVRVDTVVQPDERVIPTEPVVPAGVPPEWLESEPTTTPPAPTPTADGAWIQPTTVDDNTSRLLQRLGRYQAEQVPLEPEERRAVIASLFHEGSRRPPFLRRYATLTGMSVIIAAFGLIADSTAVIIGAMLVAPLMAPALAAAAAIVMGWPQRIRTNLALVAVGALGAVAIAAGIGIFARSTFDPIPAEIMARTQPNLLDLGIAAAAGAAGAYAYVRKQASDALAGAAIAVALVPPLSVVGLMAAAGEYRLASGATLLFVVNVAGVLASGAATFLVAGLAPGQRLLSSGSRIQDGFRWAAIATIIVAVPIQFGQTRLLAAPLNMTDVETAVDDWAESTDHDVETVDVGIEYENGEPAVDVVIATPEDEPPVEELAEVIAEKADEAVTVEIQIVETDRSVVSVEDGGKDDVVDGDVTVVEEDDGEDEDDGS